LKLKDHIEICRSQPETTPFQRHCSFHSFETRPDGSTQDPADSRLEPGRVQEKIGEEKTWCDLVDQVKNLVAASWLLFFLLKRRRIDLKKKLTRTTRWSGQNPSIELGRVWKLWLLLLLPWKLGTPPAKGKFCHTTPTRQWHEDQRSEPVSADVPPQPLDR